MSRPPLGPPSFWCGRVVIRLSVMVIRLFRCGYAHDHVFRRAGVHGHHCKMTIEWSPESP